MREFYNHKFYVAKAMLAFRRLAPPSPAVLCLLRALALGCILSCAPWLGKPAWADGFVFTSPLGDRMGIFLAGRVNERVRVQMVPLLHAYPGALVVLDSDGGGLDAGLAIGRAVRAAGAGTLVPSGASCASACALIWVGGAQRDIGISGQLGFHSSYVRRGARPVASPAGNALIGDYFRELGLGDATIARLTSTPPEDIHWLSRAELRALEIELTAMPALDLPRRRPSARADAFAALQGVWDGEMGCGETVITVRVLVWRDATGAVAAAVELGPSAESPMVAHASFQMRAVTDASGGFRFTGNQRYPNAVPDPPLLLTPSGRAGTAQAHIRAGQNCLPFSLRRPVLG